MFYFDIETGDLESTSDPEKARQHLLVVNGLAHRFGLNPQVAGRLYQMLGPADPNDTEQEARRRVQSVLDEMGLGDLQVDAVVRALDDGWQTVLGLSSGLEEQP
jgi:hypothetical protein